MKRLITTAMAAAAMSMAVTTVAAAQDAGAQQQGTRRGGGMAAMMMKDITLSDVQKTKVDSIMVAFRQKNAPLMEAARGGDADARANMGESRKAQMEAIKAVLTDEQQKQFDLNVAAMPMGRGRPPLGL